MALFLTYNEKFQETDKAENFLQFRRRFGAFVHPCAGGLITHLYACTEQWGKRFISAVAGEDNNNMMTIFGAVCSIAAFTSDDKEKQEWWRLHSEQVRNNRPSAFKAAMITGLNRHVSITDLNAILNTGYFSMYTLCQNPTQPTAAITLYTTNCFAAQQTFLDHVPDKLCVTTKSIKM